MVVWMSHCHWNFTANALQIRKSIMIASLAQDRLTIAFKIRPPCLQQPPLSTLSLNLYQNVLQRGIFYFLIFQNLGRTFRPNRFYKQGPSEGHTSVTLVLQL